MLQSEKILKGLSSAGFCIVPDFLSASEITDLKNDLFSFQTQGKFREARVGQGSAQILVSNIRRDSICWFEPTLLTPPQKLLWKRLEELKKEINSDLFLGLWDLEGHYAIYQPGGFYERHLDRFKSDDSRLVSIVLYLNSDWIPGDGGELALFLDSTDEGAPYLVEPRAGTAVFFLSDRIEHQVRPTGRERLSFAGWFRRRNTEIGHSF